MNSNHTKKTQTLLAVATAITLVAGLASCATPQGPGAAPPLVGDTPVSEGDVVGTGTVIQVGDADPEFCLGPVMESYPPQCSGVGLIGWDWAVVDGQETANDVTWGRYAVWGDFDGRSLTVTDSVMLALYDPMFEQDPALLAENAGDTPEEELATIHDTLHADAPFEVLESYTSNGYVFARVVFDDGTYQEWVDNRYGPDVVQVRSALKTVETD